MGHNIKHAIYRESIGRTAIEREINERVAAATFEECGGGLPSPIRWYDMVLDSYDAAIAFIKRNDKQWYDALAVKYQVPAPNAAKPSRKKLDELTARMKRVREQYEDLNKQVAVSEFKAQYVSCKNCGSKLNKDLLKTNCCPLCRFDMRSDTTKKRLSKLREQLDTLTEAISAEKSKVEDAAQPKEVFWLVKYEYHT